MSEKSKRDQIGDTAGGVLYVVATPIGNLGDITYRAINVLSTVDYILCEDTRVTAKLCARYHITTPRRRYDAHASGKTHENIVADLASGQRVALVSDAGTPGVNDPGVRLVGKARAAGLTVMTVPGPSALTATLAIAVREGNQFTFLGFAPSKKGRATFFTSLASYQHPVVFFESTHRIMKTLASIRELFPRARLQLGRELTKQHEELLVGTSAELTAKLTAQPARHKGEFVEVVDFNP